VPDDYYDLVTSHVIPALIRKAHEAKLQGDATMTTWGTGTPRREFLHVDDCADALVHILKVYSEAEPTGRVAVERPGVMLGDPNLDQVAADGVAPSQRVQRLSAQEFLDDLPLEFGRVGSVLGHGFLPESPVQLADSQLLTCPPPGVHSKHVNAAEQMIGRNALVEMELIELPRLVRRLPPHHRQPPSLP
jgi:hypothetical protein